MSQPITRKFPKIDQKKNTLSLEHERGVKNRVFDRGAGSAGIFSHFSCYFWHFSYFSAVLALVSLVL